MHESANSFESHPRSNSWRWKAMLREPFLESWVNFSMMKVEIALTPADAKTLVAALPPFGNDSSFRVADLLLMLFYSTTRWFQIGNSISSHLSVSVALIIETKPPMRTVCLPNEWPTPHCISICDFDEFEVRNLKDETYVLYSGLACSRVCSFAPCITYEVVITWLMIDEGDEWWLMRGERSLTFESDTKIPNLFIRNYSPNRPVNRVTLSSNLKTHLPWSFVRGIVRNVYHFSQIPQKWELLPLLRYSRADQIEMFLFAHHPWVKGVTTNCDLKNELIVRSRRIQTVCFESH